MFDVEFNLKNASIDFLREHGDQKFTYYKIAEWLVQNYHEEVRREAAVSRNTRIVERTQEEKLRKL